MWRWLKRRKPPPWARFFDQDAYEDFLSVVAEDLDRRGDFVEIDDGVASMAIGPERHRFGLQNLAQICNQSDRETWGDVVRDHFDMVIRSSAGTDLDELARDFDNVRGIIKVRLYPRDTVDTHPVEPLIKDITGELSAVLTYDLPEAVATIPAEALEGWPIDKDEAFALALENVLAQDQVEAQPLELGEGGRVFVVAGESFFVTSHMLALDHFCEPDTAFGALVCAPNRHTMLYSPIVDVTAVAAINAMLIISHRRHLEGPGSLTDALYWWRDGVFTHLPATVEDDGVQFFPTEEFLDECLNRLPKPRSGFGPN